MVPHKFRHMTQNYILIFNSNWIFSKFYLLIYILAYNLMHMHRYCGAEGFGKPGPFRIKPKAHAKKEETSEDE